MIRATERISVAGFNIIDHKSLIECGSPSYWWLGGASVSRGRSSTNFVYSQVDLFLIPDNVTVLKSNYVNNFTEISYIAISLFKLLATSRPSSSERNNCSLPHSNPFYLSLPVYLRSHTTNKSILIITCYMLNNSCSCTLV